MRQTKRHKLLLINTLHIIDETFETNETVFRGFFVLSLFFHILNTIFDVSFCLKSVSFCLISSHSVSLSDIGQSKIIDFIQKNKWGSQDNINYYLSMTYAISVGLLGLLGLFFVFFSHYHCFFRYLTRFSSPNLSHLVSIRPNSSHFVPCLFDYFFYQKTILTNKY